jgi:hypothetical protein
MATTKQAKILLYDLEVSPMLAWAYGPKWETRLLKIEQWQKIMSISFRWYGQKKIYHFNLSDHSEKELLELVAVLLDEADIAIAHNGKRFDDRISRGAFLMHDIEQPSPWKNVDTKIVAKSIGMFPSNSLNDLCEMFGFGTKSDTTYADLWYDCLIHNDKKSWKLMEKYNNQDVELLTKLYEKLRPYINNHPNIANIVGLENGCPNCGSDDLTKRGVRHTNVGTFQRLRCNSCHHWCSSRQADKEAIKPNFVNYS